MEMTAPDAARNLDGALPTCFTQYPPRPGRLPRYRVINFDLNWAAINEGQRGAAPAVRITIAGPDGTTMVAADLGPNDTGITCQAVQSYVLTRGTTGSQLVLGLTLRVPLQGAPHPPDGHGRRPHHHRATDTRLRHSRRHGQLFPG
jgi:hypothetical protein